MAIIVLSNSRDLEKSMASQFGGDLIAEPAAQSMAVTKILSTLTAPVEAGGGTREQYLCRILETGISDLDGTDDLSLPKEQWPELIENTRARYFAIVVAAQSGRGSP